VSKDGTTFTSIDILIIDAAKRNDDALIKNVVFKSSSEDVRYIKLIARKMGALPEWHLGYPHDGRSWIFADEISIK
jgi:hypothetical protein